jgi:hypothetical protein
MKAAHERFAASPTATPEGRQEIEEAFAAREQRRHPSPARPPLPPPPELPPLAMEKAIRRASELAAAARAELVVVPVTVAMDTEPLPEARPRRGVTRDEAAMVDALASELAAAARKPGAIGVDPSSALRALGPAAYLADWHLSAAGHDAVARAVVAALPSR